MLDLKSYLMGRDTVYSADFTLEVKTNALDLIKRVNNLFTALQLEVPAVTSGWRPLAVNMRAGGAKRSLHMTGRAVDLRDKTGDVKAAVMARPQFLLDYGLWMEHPDNTVGWAHFDTGVRTARLVRIFKP